MLFHIRLRKIAVGRHPSVRPMHVGRNITRILAGKMVDSENVGDKGVEKGLMTYGRSSTSGSQTNSKGHKPPSTWVSVSAAPLPNFPSNPASTAIFFHMAAFLVDRSSSFFRLSTLVVSSLTTPSISILSCVYFWIAFSSLFFSCAMYSTARCNIEPLFFSQPGTILASSLIPSLIVSRRRRSTTMH